MSSKKIPIFDLTPEQNQTLDVTQDFDQVEPRVISHNQDTIWMKDISEKQRPVYDFSLSKRLRIARFYTLGTLDLIGQELAKLPIWNMTTGDRVKERKIDINPELDVPYGSLDVRRGGAGILGRKYADLYTRRLPFWLSLQGHYVLYHKTIFLWLARCAYGVGLLFLLALPTLWYIRFSILTSLEELQKIPTLTSNREVQEATRTVRAGFERAKLLVTPYRLLFDNTLIEIDEIRALGVFIDVGTSLTRGLHTLSSTLDPYFVVPTPSNPTYETILAPVWRGEAKDMIFGEKYGITNLTGWIEKNDATIQGILRDIISANVSLQNIDFQSNSRLQPISSVKSLLSNASSIAQIYLEHQTDLLMMLGNTLPQRYLILNQNQDEIRANGGFPGSVITFGLYKGNIQSFRKDDVYYYDWNLFPYKEIPPPGLALLSNNFGLRDVNYFPIFRQSIEKANEFIEKSGDTTITTGVAIHQGIIIDILKLVGPIELKDVPMPITADNFSTFMSTLVEAKHAEIVSPKDILFLFIDELFKEMNDPRKLASVIEVLGRAMQDGEILVASRDEKVDAFLQSVGFHEKWLEDKGNWVYPLFTSLSGNKSDRYMERAYSASIKTLSGCTVENAVTVKSSHTFSTTDTKEINSYLDMLGITEKKDRDNLLFIEGNGLNKQYVRLIVPPTAELVGKGVNLDHEDGELYDTISFMLETPVGAKSERMVRYTVTPLNCQSDINWYRQPGLHTLEIVR